MIAELRWRWRVEWTALTDTERIEVGGLWLAEQRAQRGA